MLEAVPRVLETPRLRLRPPEPTDAKGIFDTYAQDAEVTRYLIWRPHQQIAETEAFLRRCEDVWRERSAFPWAIIRRDDGQLIGMIELRIQGHRADLGYVLARPHWGQGYTTEATRAVVDWALTQSEIWRVWALCDVENPASARVLEKAGMQREGILRRWIIHPNASAAPRDCYCYAAVRPAERSAQELCP